MERLKEKRNEEGISEKEKRKNIEVEVRSSIWLVSLSGYAGSQKT